MRMWSSKHILSSIGYVQGAHGEETLVCQFTHMTNSQGCLWFGGNPAAFTVPLVLIQFVVISAVTSLIWFLIKPYKQGLISAQLIGGIIMGRSFLGRIDAYRDTLFSPGGTMILETYADLGLMLYLFILGVQIDVSLVKRLEKTAVVIGAACFLVPLTVGLATIFIISGLIELEPSVKQSLTLVACLNAVSSFPVITSLLADLNILNSEVGRVATLASLVSDICNYILSVVLGSMAVYLISESLAVLWSIVWAAIFLFIIVFGFRPIIILVAERVPEGQQMKEFQFVVIIVIVLICGMGAEVIGQPAGLGTFILGVVIPDGPSLGSSLVNKLDTITTKLLLPAKFVISGVSIDLFTISGVSGPIFVLVIFICYTAKFTGILIPSLYYNFPKRDAVTLALIMCCKGVVEAALYITMLEEGIIGSEAYAILLISMLMVTGLARPLIWHLYDPSARYLGQHNNSVLLNHPNDDLRMLVCIHNADNVPAIINLLDASNPTRNRPITIFVLNLIELKGRAASVLESNRKGKLTSSRSWSKQAANAFNLFAQRNHESVVVRHFTSIAPYASMHDDICTLAVDQNANIMLIPFHKQWTIDNRVGTNSPSIRMVNQNVITKSPCSVGILVDRGAVAMGGQPRLFQISLLFLGGLDDCEALAFCTRFIENPQISLMFVWIRPCDHGISDEETETSTMETEIELVNQFRAKTIGNERITYKEEWVKDAIGTTRVIRSINQYGCDLCIVGRYHDPDSPILLGLTEWSECPELGLIGDMLATSDFQFSVLVVRQQPPVTGFSDSHHLRPIASRYSSSTSYSNHYQDHHSYSFQEPVCHSLRT
ncbi:hypothetical protein DH2020_000669 [Rehmannia glutinosa]|uniref:Cation/H+ exchanger domain-containing protein n=1 Tax=Rehmannia glutinosa TaxID=99300 RepID=A0ABR0XXU2_REHGL